MKLIGQTLKFEKCRDSWICLNKAAGYRVGIVSYYALWEAWVFTPSKNSSFSTDMLDDVKSFMEQLK